MALVDLCRTAADKLRIEIAQREEAQQREDACIDAVFSPLKAELVALAYQGAVRDVTCFEPDDHCTLNKIRLFRLRYTAGAVDKVVEITGHYSEYGHFISVSTEGTPLLTWKQVRVELADSPRALAELLAPLFI